MPSTSRYPKRPITGASHDERAQQLDMSIFPNGKETYGPEMALLRLEKLGLSDGLLAKAMRKALAGNVNGSLTIDAAFVVPDDPLDLSR